MTRQEMIKKKLQETEPVVTWELMLKELSIERAKDYEYWNNKLNSLEKTMLDWKENADKKLDMLVFRFITINDLNKTISALDIKIRKYLYKLCVAPIIISTVALLFCGIKQRGRK